MGTAPSCTIAVVSWFLGNADEIMAGRLLDAANPSGDTAYWRRDHAGFFRPTPTGGSWAAARHRLRVWLCRRPGLCTGVDPYDNDRYQQLAPAVGLDKLACNFAYAPTAAGLFIPVSWLSPAGWNAVMASMNVLAACLGGFVLAVAVKRQGETLVGSGSWTVLWSSGAAALLIASPFSSANLYTGQTTLVPLALALLAYVTEVRRLPAWQGVLLALASFKIVTVILVIFWVLGRRQWQTWLAFLGTSLLLASVPLWQLGPIDLTKHWLQALQLYKSYPQNQPDFTSSFGLSALLHPFGLPTGWSPFLALALFGYVVYRRRYLTSFEPYAVSLALPVLFISGHIYDAITLVPLGIAALLATWPQRNVFWPTALLVLLESMPPRFWSFFPEHSRDLIGILFLIPWMLAIECRVRKETRSAR